MRIAGVGACIAAGLVIIGAHSPWFDFSLLGISVHIAGTSSHLDGQLASGLGIAGLVLGVVIVVLPSSARVRRPASLGLVGLGLAGIALMWHQLRDLSANAALVSHSIGLPPIAKFFGAHASASWGFWLDVAAFAGLAMSAAAGLTASRRVGEGYSSRSEPPSTGITQPVRYDAAGESTKAATWPNSSGSP